MSPCSGFEEICGQQTMPDYIAPSQQARTFFQFLFSIRSFWIDSKTKLTGVSNSFMNR